MAGDQLELEGLVTKARGNGLFSVKVEDIESDIPCTLSGKIRNNKITIIEGDKVKISMSPYDLSKGRIVFRFKG